MLELLQAWAVKHPGHGSGRHHQHDRTHCPGGATGKGNLNFQGQSYAFQLGGGVTGGGASDAQVSGEVYGLKNISDFAGLYTQSTGGAGLDRSSTSDLWLRNRAGVVLHLTGTQTGVVLSLGREEILIEML